MTTQFSIRAISAAETRPLRHAILRPHLPFAEMTFDGDDSPDSLHVGAFIGEELVGIASVSRAPLPGETNPRAWKLRGMATKEKARRMGCGRALIEACVAHIRSHNGDMIWCNGRTSALGFYRAMGFETRGDEFESPSGTGPHYVMVRHLE